MPVSQHGNKLAGQSEMGGVWEWTSTVLDPHEGFEAMPLYPGYTGEGPWYIRVEYVLTCLRSRLLRWQAQRRAWWILGNAPAHCRTQELVSGFPCFGMMCLLTICSVNWYQRNYPFVWAGARMVKDA